MDLAGLGVCELLSLYIPGWGGGATQVHRLAPALRDAGARVFIVAGWFDDDWPHFELVDGVPLYRNYAWGPRGPDGKHRRGYHRYGTGLPIYFASLAALLVQKRAEYQIIHIYQATEHAFMGVVLGKLLRKKTVVRPSNTGDYSDRNYLLRIRGKLVGSIMWKVICLADHFASLSSRMTTELIRDGVPAHRVSNIPNGVNISAFRPVHSFQEHLAARQQVGLPNRPTVVFVSRLKKYQKGFDILLTAWQIVVTKLPNAQLVLVGKGQDYNELLSCAEKLGIAANVVFAGERADVYPFLAATDVFVIPSRAEGLSNALLEAMACGLPIVATRVSGNEDLIKHGVNGFLVPSEEPASLAHHLIELLENEAERERLGHRAWETIKAGYDIRDIAERYVALFQRLLSAEN